MGIHQRMNESEEMSLGFEEDDVVYKSLVVRRVDLTGEKRHLWLDPVHQRSHLLCLTRWADRPSLSDHADGSTLNSKAPKPQSPIYRNATGTASVPRAGRWAAGAEVCRPGASPILVNTSYPTAMAAKKLGACMECR